MFPSSRRLRCGGILPGSTQTLRSQKSLEFTVEIGGDAHRMRYLEDLRGTGSVKLERDLGLATVAPQDGRQLADRRFRRPLLRKQQHERPRLAQREPHRLARYLEATAATFHKFYDSCRVLPQGDEAVSDLHRARLLLVGATRIVFANGLGMLGVTAPERM